MAINTTRTKFIVFRTRGKRVDPNDCLLVYNDDEIGVAEDPNLIYPITRIYMIVLLPENLHTCFEPSVQAWILYKAPQWNARCPNSCPERIKLKMH